MSLKKIKTIANAFISPLPTGEDWYEARVEACNGCEMNTKNIEESSLAFTDKLKIKSGLCDEGNHCTACGCCILRKCSVKSEVCGMSTLKRTPKWFPIAVEGLDNITLEVVGDNVKVTATPKEFLVDFGSSSDAVLKTSFILGSESSIKFDKYSVSCGCTHPEKITQLDQNKIELQVTVSTLGFRPGLNEKLLTVEYKNNRGKFKSAVIRFRVIKL